jgi:ParB family chromosome partitioning protein
MTHNAQRITPEPPLHRTVGSDEIFQFPDDIWITCQAPILDAYGRVWSDVRAHRGEETFGRGQINLLDSRTRDTLAASCAAVDGMVSWKPRLLCVADSLADYLKQQQAQVGDDIWAQALTVDEFLDQHEEALPATVRDMVMPGMITLLSAHRGSGKTTVALYLGTAMAQGGVFRGERLTPQRVFVVDRDNPPSLIRTRMRHLGARGAQTFRVLTRDKAPSLTERDRAAWDRFPFEDYDVVLIDSIGAFTEGISEREGKETQEWLSILKDLALRGPAIIGLCNTNKAGVNIRGRGEIPNAVDIVYECRNVTGWTPTGESDWVSELPERGEHTWQATASQQARHQGLLQIAFIATKFRLGMTPEPFILEVDMRQDRWTLSDVTAQIVAAGAQAADDARDEERLKLTIAADDLVQHIRAQQPAPVLQMQAMTVLRSYGLTKRQAEALLKDGYNADRHPDHGLWYLRPIPGSKGNAIGVYLVHNGPGDDGGTNSEPVGEDFNGTNNIRKKSPTQSNEIFSTDLFRGSTRRGTNSTDPEIQSNCALHGGDHLFRAESSGGTNSTPGTSAETLDKSDTTIICSTSTHTSDADAACTVCKGVIRWNDAGIWRCVVCWPPKHPLHGAPVPLLTADATPAPAIFTEMQDPEVPAEPPSILARLNSGDSEWYTPKEWIERARAVMGSIDVEPASCAQAQAIVQATIYYTMYDSGLDHYWYKNVWLNPPFSAILVKKFCGKLVEEWDAGRTAAAIVLVNSATETRWFQLLMRRATVMCCLNERIGFISAAGTASQPARGQTVFYFGPDPDRFGEVFGPHGSLLRLVGRAGDHDLGSQS